jgi:hypothetical protein
MSGSQSQSSTSARYGGRPDAIGDGRHGFRGSSARYPHSRLQWSFQQVRAPVSCDSFRLVPNGFPGPSQLSQDWRCGKRKEKCPDIYSTLKRCNLNLACWRWNRGNRRTSSRSRVPGLWITQLPALGEKRQTFTVTSLDRVLNLRQRLECLKNVYCKNDISAAVLFSIPMKWPGSAMYSLPLAGMRPRRIRPSVWTGKERLSVWSSECSWIGMWEWQDRTT